MQFSKTVLASLLFAAAAYAQTSTQTLPPAPTAGDPGSTTGALGDAKPELDNPTGKTYVADFSGTKLQGRIKFTSSLEEGEPVHVAVELRGFPIVGGPFAYHVHDQPVPPDGNCTETKAHLDPYLRGGVVACDPTKPQTCEVGDLAGKHGKIPETIGNGTYTASYDDQYITLEEGKGSFIGNRSIVIHLADKSRYTCVNITEMIKTPPSPPPPSEGAAYKYGPGYWGCGVAVAAGLRYLLV